MTNRKPPGSADPRATKSDGPPRRQDASPSARGGAAPVRRQPTGEDRAPTSAAARFGSASPRELTDPPERAPRSAPPRQSRQPDDQHRQPPTKPTRNRSPSAKSRAARKPRRRIWPWLVAGLAATFAAVAGIAIFAADSLVPVDTIRDHLVAEVKARTGRDLVVGKRAALSLWPRPSVSLTDVTLSEPPAMGRAPFARAATVEAEAEFWPLLTGQVKLERLTLRDPVVQLRVDRDGRRNWDFADASAERIRYAQAKITTDAAPLPKDLEDFAKGSTPSMASNGRQRPELPLHRIEVVNGTLRHTDERTGATEIVTAVDARIAADDLAAPLSIEGKGTWRNRTVSTSAELRPFRAVLEKRQVAVRSEMKGEGFAVTYAGNALPSSGTDLDGKITVKAASIQDVSAWIGRPLGGGSANGPLDLSASTRADASGIALNDLQVAVNGMTAAGNVTIALAGPQRPRLAGNLQLSAIDLDQLGAIRALDGQARDQPPPTAAPASIDDLLKPKAAMPAAPALKPQVRGFTGRPGWSDEPINLAAFGQIDADLKLAFAGLKSAKLKTGRGQLALSLANKSARLDIQDLQLYDGRAKGVITADATNAAAAVVGANIALDGVSALEFLRDAGGVDIVAGKARIAAALAGQGASERQIVETLTGKAEIAMANGAIIGISIPKILQALSQGRNPSFERVPNDRSDFSELAGSVNIVNGLAQNQDLRFTTREVRVTGAGAINLPARTIDYVARPKLTGPQTIQVGQMTLNVGQVEVPVKIAGTFDKLAVAPDFGVVKNPNHALEAVKQLDKKEVESTVKGVIEGDPNAKAKARDFLKNLLKQ